MHCKLCFSISRGESSLYGTSVCLGGCLGRPHAQVDQPFGRGFRRNSPAKSCNPWFDDRKNVFIHCIASVLFAQVDHVCQDMFDAEQCFTTVLGP